MGCSGWLSRVGVVRVWQRTDTVSFLPSRAVAGEAGEQGLTSLIECQLQGEPRKAVLFIRGGTRLLMWDNVSLIFYLH